MKNEFIINIIHRPELSPEYAEKSGGKKSKSVAEESLDIFLFQQEAAHKNGLRTTIHITYASLFNDDIVRIAKEHNALYGDEIALSLLGLPCKEFKEKYKTDDFCIWMFSKEDKEKIVDDVFSLFYEKFGFYPKSTGSYFLDAYTINYIKSNKLVYDYLRVNSYWYKYLNRSGINLKPFEEEMKRSYKLTSEDRMKKMADGINSLSKIMDILS